MKPKRVNVEGLARLPAFSHAVVAGDFIYVSGTLGVKPNSMELVVVIC
jgi:enamine deaminase RidA (YjgF/YER057c/UK114 family)